MRILVIGLGGIGKVLTPILARYLNYSHPQTSLHLIDGDHYESGNKTRQEFTQLGNKAEVTAQELEPKFKMLRIQAHPEYIHDGNIYRLITEEDIVFLCVDRHTVRREVSDRCEDLSNILLISGGNELTDGAIQVYHRKNAFDLTLPLANEFHPEITEATGLNPAEESCEDLINRNSEPQLLFTNAMAAILMLNAFYRYVQKNEIGYDEAYFDILMNRVRPVQRSNHKEVIDE